MTKKVSIQISLILYNSNSSKEVKSHNPPIHQHSAASLLTSVASASFAMASIEGKPPVTVTVTSTTISSSPPSATSGAVASATVALLPSTMVIKYVLNI